MFTALNGHKINNLPTAIVDLRHNLIKNDNGLTTIVDTATVKIGNNKYSVKLIVNKEACMAYVTTMENSVSRVLRGISRMVTGTQANSLALKQFLETKVTEKLEKEKTNREREKSTKNNLATSQYPFFSISGHVNLSPTPENKTKNSNNASSNSMYPEKLSPLFDSSEISLDEQEEKEPVSLNTSGEGMLFSNDPGNSQVSSSANSQGSESESEDSKFQPLLEKLPRRAASCEMYSDSEKDSDRKNFSKITPSYYLHYPLSARLEPLNLATDPTGKTPYELGELGETEIGIPSSESQNWDIKIHAMKVKQELKISCEKNIENHKNLIWEAEKNIKKCEENIISLKQQITENYNLIGNHTENICKNKEQLRRCLIKEKFLMRKLNREPEIVQRIFAKNNEESNASAREILAESRQKKAPLLDKFHEDRKALNKANADSIKLNQQVNEQIENITEQYKEITHHQNEIKTLQGEIDGIVAKKEGTQGL
jgi:hypothetical protein